MPPLEVRSDSPGETPKNPKIHVSTERNTQVPAQTPHQVLGPGIDGREIRSVPLATRMITGLSCGRQSGSLNPRRNSRAPAETREYPGASPFQAT